MRDRESESVIRGGHRPECGSAFRRDAGATDTPQVRRPECALSRSAGAGQAGATEGRSPCALKRGRGRMSGGAATVGMLCPRLSRGVAGKRSGVAGYVG